MIADEEDPGDVSLSHLHRPRPAARRSPLRIGAGLIEWGSRAHTPTVGAREAPGVGMNHRAPSVADPDGTLHGPEEAGVRAGGAPGGADTWSTPPEGAPPGRRVSRGSRRELRLEHNASRDPPSLDVRDRLVDAIQRARL